MLEIGIGTLILIIGFSAGLPTLIKESIKFYKDMKQ